MTDDLKYWVQLTPDDLQKPASVIFAPAEFSQQLDAWDSVPTTMPGQVWEVGALVQAPAGARITVTPVIFSRPDGTRTLDPTTDTITADGTPQRLSVQIIPQTPFRWVGVMVTVDQLPDWLYMDTGVGMTAILDGTNQVPDPNATRPYPIYTAADTTSVIDVIAIDDHPAGITTANRLTWSNGASYPGWLLTPNVSTGTVTVSAWLKASRSITGAFAIAGVSTGAAINLTTSWQRFSFTYTLTGTARRIGFRISSSSANAGVIYMAGVQLEDGSAMTGFIAGDQPDQPIAGGEDFRSFTWDGTPNDSISHRWLNTAAARSWLDVPDTWLDYATSYIYQVSVLAPGEVAARRASVFSGRITDLSAKWDESFSRPDGGFGGVRISVTAQDFTADLDNIMVGDEPWAVEALQDRFRRIVALSGYQLETRIDASIGDYLVSYQDVDNQPVTGLLKDLAQSVDAVMWSAVHLTTGPYVHVEDPATRAALYTLSVDENGIVQIIPSFEGDAAQEISACDVLRDPVEWTQSVSDVSTRVAVRWLEQGVNEEGRPETTERTLTVIDAQLEAVYGYRRISFSTMLQAEADARRVADRILGRTSVTGWRANAFTIGDTTLSTITDAIVQMMLRLLDGTSRIGLPLRLTGMPDWTPVGTRVPVYLEGGEYVYEDGLWTLALKVAQASGQGTSVPWVNLDPAWSWVDFDPTIDWLDLNGVTYTPPVPIPFPPLEVTA